jgi:Fur family ferric uptake transcriptional regulator
MVERMRRSGVRVTAPRRAVVEALVDLGSHATAEQLHEHVRSRNPEVSVTSVYRTMDLLARLGLVTHVHLGHGPAEYHLADDDHSHLVCDGCGAVVELPPQLSAPFAEEVGRRTGFRLELQHFALTGRCARCAEGFDPGGAGQEG